MAAKGRTTDRANAGESEGGRRPFSRGIFPPLSSLPRLSAFLPSGASASLSLSLFHCRAAVACSSLPLLFSRLRQSREGSPFGGGGPTTDCRGQRREGTSQSFIGASAVEKGENRQEVERAPPLLRRRSCCELRSERRRKIIPQSKSKALASQSVVSAQLQFLRRQTRLS